MAKGNGFQHFSEYGTVMVFQGVRRENQSLCMTDWLFVCCLRSGSSMSKGLLSMEYLLSRGNPGPSKANDKIMSFIVVRTETSATLVVFKEKRKRFIL